MNPINDGGPAFPTDAICKSSGRLLHQNFGMSLLDHFAGLAMPALIVAGHDMQQAATNAYATAAAMIAERERILRGDP
jgi:hypothetical protein